MKERKFGPLDRAKNNNENGGRRKKKTKKAEERERRKEKKENGTQELGVQHYSKYQPQ